MYKKYHVILVCCIFHYCAIGQIKISSIASTGGNFKIAGASYMQVIGQSSVISGRSDLASTRIMQGFKQPILLEKFIQKQVSLESIEEDKSWDYEVYPNPFIENLTIRFKNPTKSPVAISLIDMSGNIIWEDNYLSNLNELKLDKFQNVQMGKYIIRVFYKGAPQSKFLIKGLN